MPGAAKREIAEIGDSRFAGEKVSIENDDAEQKRLDGGMRLVRRVEFGNGAGHVKVNRSLRYTQNHADFARGFTGRSPA